MEGLSVWLNRRSAPVLATMAMLVAVMAFSLLGHHLVHFGRGVLLAPGDLWSLALSSTAILHGDFARVYVHDGALTSPPAFELALAPVVALGHALGLSPRLHAPGMPLSMWFVLGPAAVLMASPALFAVDAVARAWRFSERQRLAVALVGALGVATVAGYWGHPEDCLALAFVVWAALAMDRFGASAAPRAAWLLGVGIAFQPLALLGVVPVLARLPWRDAARVSWRLLVPSIVVVLPPLLAETRQTLFVLVHQPFQPAYNSFTPLTRLAPHIGPGLDGGGPTRLVAIVLSGALALAVCRRRHDLATVLTMAAVAFFVRVLLETELNWYYLWPVPALCLLLAMRRSAARFWVCALALAASLLLGRHAVHAIALWWPACIVATTLVLLTALPSIALPWPRRPTRAPRPPLGDPEPARPVEFAPMSEHVGAGGRRE